MVAGRQGRSGGTPEGTAGFSLPSLPQGKQPDLTPTSAAALKASGRGFGKQSSVTNLKSKRRLSDELSRSNSSKEGIHFVMKPVFSADKSFDEPSEADMQLLEDSLGDIDDGDLNGKMLQEYCKKVKSTREPDAEVNLSFSIPREASTGVLRPSDELEKPPLTAAPELPEAVAPCPQIITQSQELLPLNSLHYDIKLQIYHASITMKGVWENNSAQQQPIHCLLAVPHSPTSTVHSFTVKTGDRILTSMVVNFETLMEKQISPKYPQGSLLDATGWSPSLFRLSIPEVKPGGQIHVELHYTESLQPFPDCYQLHIPLTLPLSMIDQHKGLQDRISVKVKLQCWIPQTVWNASHPLRVQADTDEFKILTSNSSAPWSNKDFLFKYSMPVSEITSVIHCTEVQSNNKQPLHSLSLFIQPPKSLAGPLFNKKMVYLINRTHTMKGSRLAAILKGLEAAWDSQGEQDQYCVIIFDLRKVILQPGVNGLKPATEENKTATQTWLTSFFSQDLAEEPVPDEEADVATQLEEAVRKTLDVLGASKESNPEEEEEDLSHKGCLLITDCEVGEEIERNIVRHLKEENDGVRFYTFGIGLDCNPSFLKLAAEISQGVHESCLDLAWLDTSLARFIRSLERPLLRDVNLFISNVTDVEVYPDPPPDLFRDRPVHIGATFCGDVPETILVTGQLPTGLLYCEPCPVIKTHYDDMNFEAMLSGCAMERYVSCAWMEQSDVLDTDVMNISCERETPCVGWAGSTSMVVIDCTQDLHDEMQRTTAPKIAQLGRTKYNNYLIETGVVDNEVHIVGTTPLVFEELSQTRCGELQVALKEQERIKQLSLMKVVESERDLRLELAQEEVEERRANLRSLTLLVRQQELQQKAFLRNEEADRDTILKQEDAAYKAILKMTKYERKVRKRSGYPSGEGGAASPTSPASPDSPPKGANIKTTDWADLTPSAQDPTSATGESVASMELKASSSFGTTSFQKRAAPTDKLGSLEEDEHQSRIEIIQQQLDQWAHMESGVLRETIATKRRGDKKMEEEHYPRLSKKWKAWRKAQFQGAVLDNNTGLDSSDGELWRLVTSDRAVSANDMVWVMSQMRQNQPTPEIIIECLSILSRWVASGDKDNQANLSAQGGVCEIIKAMRVFPGNIEIQYLACKALCELANSKNNALIEREGGIFMILQTLKNFQNDPRAVHVAMQCIIPLATHSLAYRRTIARKGAVTLILRSMVEFNDDATVVGTGIGALAALAIANDVASDNQNTIATQGGLDLIFQAMRKFPTNCSLLTNAVQALDQLSGFNHFNKSIMLSGGATSLILSSMMSFPNNAKLLSHAISALGTLASNIYACESIVKQGGIQLIVECITAFPHQMKLLAKARHCIDLLKRVEREGVGGSHAFMRPDVIHFVRCVMQIGEQRDTKLIGYCGSVECEGLYRSIQSTFETKGNIVIKFTTPDTENAVLTPESLPLFLASPSNRLLCLPAEDADKFPVTRIEKRPHSTGSDPVYNANSNISSAIIKDRLLTKGILNWNEQDVQSWLARVVELPRYTSIFARLQTVGKDLLKYTDATLSSYNITSRKDVAKILRSIEDIKKSQVTSPLSPMARV